MTSKIVQALIIIFIISCSISTVAAADNNETYSVDNTNYNDVIATDNDGLNAVNVQKTESLSYPRDNSSYLNKKDNPYRLNSSTSVLDSTKKYYGVVDLGSNVLSLKIYEEENNEFRIALTEDEKSVTAEYKENNLLNQEGINQLISILNDFDGKMNSYNVDQKYFFATASLRKIDNTDEVISRVKNQSGIDLHVLTGEEEAKVGFDAVKFTDLTDDNGLLIDLGGGSCEVIPFMNKTPLSMKSIPIGSLSCYTEYVNSTFPNENEIDEIQNRVELELNKLNISNLEPIYDLYGNGGTIYTIKQVLIYLGDISNDTYVVSTSKLDSLLNRLLQNTTETYNIISNVSASRINTLLPGIVITKQISNHFQAKTLHFCKSQLEEGILYLIKNRNIYNNSQSIISDINDTHNDNKIIVSDATVTWDDDIYIHPKNIEILLGDVILPVENDSHTNQYNETASNNNTSDLTENNLNVVPLILVLLCFIPLAIYNNRK